MQISRTFFPYDSKIGLWELWFWHDLAVYMLFLILILGWPQIRPSPKTLCFSCQFIPWSILFLKLTTIKYYKYETIISTPGCSFLNLFLYFILRGLDLSLFPQQGHQRLGHVINTEHVLHRFWPIEYRLSHEIFRALWRLQMSLHANRIWILLELYLKYSTT